MSAHHGQHSVRIRGDADTTDHIITLRRQRRCYRHISQDVGVSQSTVSRVLQRAGLNRLSELDPAPPVRRYTHEAPGDLLHLDIKKLGRFERPGHRMTGDRRLGQSRGGRLGVYPCGHR